MMNTLTVFSEKEREYDRYQARMEYLRQKNTIQFELEEARKASEINLIHLIKTPLS